ncbi:SAM hydrolase/SAM-dependent halogenase family protein [Haloarcula brevis]|uniref:SAM hydrolase/SAM-dependent halogenase family protein n=1 Tax=Haloarcula brevis TaxID=3111453 RepID=UPI00300F2B62
MSTFVHLVADYGPADPAFSEVVHRLTAADPTMTVQSTAVRPFSTVATGFWLAQLGVHNPSFDDLLIYSNTAPRTAETTPERADTGGPLCYLELDTGVPVVAVDAGYNLSFVADHATTVREVELPADTGQFRSRDLFPRRVAELANGDRSSLGAERSLADVPAPPESVVCHVDGYGNVKTSIRASAFDPERDTVTVELNGESRDAVVRDAVSEVPEGTLAVVPGSAGGEDPYQELFLRGGSAASAFGRPEPGDELTVRG